MRQGSWPSWPGRPCTAARRSTRAAPATAELAGHPEIFVEARRGLAKRFSCSSSPRVRGWRRGARASTRAYRSWRLGPAAPTLCAGPSASAVPAGGGPDLIGLRPAPHAGCGARAAVTAPRTLSARRRRVRAGGPITPASETAPRRRRSSPPRCATRRGPSPQRGSGAEPAKAWAREREGAWPSHRAGFDIEV
jgi:hypothetical protein